MDEQLKSLITLANSRGSQYMKGESSIKEIPDKMAELGVYLLSKTNRVKELDGDRLREQLNEIQQKIDDLRKAIFANKLKSNK
jgi:cob(I)alamin adenosyltransferase